MNKRIILCALLVTALSLTPGTSRARLYNVNTGRFQTMDTYQGNNEDPLSLHKYLYCKADPVNFVDPSGHDAIEMSNNFAILGALASMPNLVTVEGATAR